MKQFIVYVERTSEVEFLVDAETKEEAEQIVLTKGREQGADELDNHVLENRTIEVEGSVH